MADFPPASVTSTTAVEWIGEEVDDANLKVTFENRTEAVRSRNSRGRWDNIRCRCRVNATDMDAIFSLLIGKRLERDTLTIDHPRLGVKTVRYASDRLPRVVMVNGNPAWFEFELAFREMF